MTCWWHEEAVASAEAQWRAMEDQGEAARRGYQLGTMSITDSHEAKAKAELARAQFIAAQNDLEDQTGGTGTAHQPAGRQAGRAAPPEAAAPAPGAG